jgi:hypothetical protein
MDRACACLERRQGVWRRRGNGFPHVALAFPGLLKPGRSERFTAARGRFLAVRDGARSRCARPGLRSRGVGMS